MNVALLVVYCICGQEKTLERPTRVAPGYSPAKIPSIVPSTGRTKQALNWPSSVPAFMSVGLLGRKSKDVSRR